MNVFTAFQKAWQHKESSMKKIHSSISHHHIMGSFVINYHCLFVVKIGTFRTKRLSSKVFSCKNKILELNKGKRIQLEVRLIRHSENYTYTYVPYITLIGQYICHFSFASKLEKVASMVVMQP